MTKTNPHTPSKGDLLAGFKTIVAVADAIRAAGSIPSGTLYAMLIGRVSIDGYQSIIRTLKNAGLVAESMNELRWIGPKVVE